jgi:galactofuranose transport system substrate-binding protein
MRMFRNSALTILVLSLFTVIGSGQSTPKKLVVGFSQVGAESGWRTANTNSLKSAAAARGIDLHFSDAQQKQENQIKALKDFAAQHVDAITFSPVVETGWAPVLRDIKAKPAFP